jgi:two-component system, OmpR family, alkaline phosphatase synthesis response regulator PhoP
MPETLRRRILLVEDEESLVITLTDRLLAEGYAVDRAGDGDTALQLGSSGQYDLIVLDVALPGKNGFDVCRDLRQRGVNTPILMLTARGQVIDRVLGLKLGADDYLTKPFDMLELLARIEALFRRSRAAVAQPSETYTFGDVRVDFRRAEVQRDGNAVELSGLELRLLRYFIEHRGSLLTRDELLDKVWGYGATLATRTVDVHVASLRQKIGAKHVVTVHGLGYKFVG